MAEKMKSAEAAAPLIDNGDVKKLLSLLSKVEGDRAKEFSQLIAYVDAMGRQFGAGAGAGAAGRAATKPGQKGAVRCGDGA